MKCMICSCTHERPCEPPCGWAAMGLCTNCAGLVLVLDSWAESAYRATPAGLVRALACAKEERFERSIQTRKPRNRKGRERL